MVTFTVISVLINIIQDLQKGLLINTCTIDPPGKKVPHICNNTSKYPGTYAHEIIHCYTIFEEKNIA